VSFGDQTESGSAISIRLEPGSHRSPNDGVCIIELASIIGGERFSDRPDCVCPVIASFLRGWNDRAGYADRQRLYPYASRVVGTGGYRRISRIRRDLCLRWAGADLDRGPLWRTASRLRMRGRIAWAIGLWPAIRLKDGAGAYAARAAFAHGGSDEAFELLDRLLGTGGDPTPTGSKLPRGWTPARLEQLTPPERNGNGNGNGNGRHADELGVRATIIAREGGKLRRRRARSRR
jgi:hypothetical protein